jgi:RNA polymerase sigma-70 factor (ECF subfamily)
MELRMSDSPDPSAAEPALTVAGWDLPSAQAGENWPDTDHPALSTLRKGSAEDKEAALRRLFIAYAAPLRQYIRHHWPQLPKTDIDDLVSKFMTLCLTGEKAHFLTYDPWRNGSKARLRTYLRVVLDNFLRSHHRSTHTQIRGGDRQFESLNTICPAAHQETPADGNDPSRGLDIEFYDRHWAQHVLGVSFRALENGTPANREWLPVLRPWILADPGDASLKQIAIDQGCTHDSVRTHLHRLRKAWRQAVRDTVAQTVADPAEIDDELRHLAAVLGRHPVE